MKKLSLLSITILASITLAACSSNNKTNQSKSQVEPDKTTTQEVKNDEPNGKVDYDVADMNVKITDSFNESIQFNQDGADGYEWTAYINEIKLKDNGAVQVTVSDDFIILDDAQKTEVLNHVSTTVNMVVFIETSENKSYFITAFDTNNTKVAQSKVTKVTEYKFY